MALICPQARTGPSPRGDRVPSQVAQLWSQPRLGVEKAGGAAPRLQGRRLEGVGPPGKADAEREAGGGGAVREGSGSPGRHPRRPGTGVGRRGRPGTGGAERALRAGRPRRTRPPQGSMGVECLRKPPAAGLTGLVQAVRSPGGSGGDRGARAFSVGKCLLGWSGGLGVTGADGPYSHASVRSHGPAALSPPGWVRRRGVPAAMQ